MSECAACGGSKEIIVDKGTHTDVLPCETCAPPILTCDGILLLGAKDLPAAPGRPHTPITFRGQRCPLCECLKGVQSENRTNENNADAGEKMAWVSSGASTPG